MEDSYDLSLTFAETHLAEIQAVLPKLNGSAEKQSADTLSFARESISTPTEQKSSGTVAEKSTPISSSVGFIESFEHGTTDDDSNSSPRIFTIHITGEEAGEYRLVVFNGKLKKYTNFKPEQRFIPLVHQGRDKLMPVSFIKEEQTLYVAKKIYEVLLKYADYFDVSLDYILGRCDEPEGRLYKHQPRIGRGNPDMQKFVEMCFDPASPMNARLKETLLKMLEENS